MGQYYTIDSNALEQLWAITKPSAVFGWQWTNPMQPAAVLCRQSCQCEAIGSNTLKKQRTIRRTLAVTVGGIMLSVAMF